MKNEMLRLAAQLEKLDTRLDGLELSTSQALSIKADRSEVTAVAEKFESKADRSELDVMRADIKGVKESKVSYKQYYWMLTFISAILIGVLGYIVQRLDKASGDISFIRGKFDPVDSVIFEEEK